MERHNIAYEEDNTLIPPGYLTQRTEHGTALLVSPSVFVLTVKTTKYHMHHSLGNGIPCIAVIYLENDVLFVHEQWPFRFADLPWEAKFAVNVIELTSEELRHITDVGYAAFVADKIRGY
jgi:hypothetical protein